VTVRVFDAWDANDPALVNSHQVALWTVQSLGDATVREAADVTATTVAQDLADERHVGFVCCGHGSDRALWSVGELAGREAVLDTHSLGAIGPRWFHAFACLSGNGLAVTAPREKVGAYAGYNVKVVVEFTVGALPEGLEPLLVAAVTATTHALARGFREQQTIDCQAVIKDVRASSRRLRAWLLAHQRTCLRMMSEPEWVGLQTLATLLHASLELHGTQVT